MSLDNSQQTAFASEPDLAGEAVQANPQPLYQEAAAPAEVERAADQSGGSGLPSSAAFELPRRTTRHAIRVPDQFLETVNSASPRQTARTMTCPRILGLPSVRLSLA